MLAYFFYRCVVLLLAHLPFRGIYFLSDVLCFVLFRVIRYRRSTTYQNLGRSFPNLPQQEIDRIAWATYRNLSDIFMESIKSFGMSRSDFLARYKLLNPAVADEYAERGQSIIIAAPHYGNWEWGVTCLPIQIKHPLVGIHRPLANKYINDFQAKTRTNFGLTLAPASQTTLTFDSRREQTAAFFMMPDGSPSKAAHVHWVQFLGQKTACIYGVAKHSQRLQYPVLYAHISRIGRGYYEVSLSVLIEDPNKYTPEAITEAFMQQLEQHLRQKPDDWLWTHKRWKRTQGLM